MKPSLLRVAMVDDHTLVLDAVARLLALEPDLAVVATADTLADARRLVSETTPHVLVTDLQMGSPGDGLEFIRWARGLPSPPGIVVLSMFDGREFRERALRLGARAYVTKDAPPQALVDAVRRAGRRNAARRPASKSGASPGSAGLTNRETEVYRLLGHGLTTRQIARALGISDKTVETHRGHLMRKLAVPNAPQLVRRAVLSLNEASAEPPAGDAPG